MTYDWIDEACARLLASPSLASLGDWLGGEPDGDHVYVPGALGGLHAFALVDSVTVGYAQATAPTLAEAEHVLGPARELPRGSAGPFQVAFPSRGALIAATTYDPPGAE